MLADRLGRALENLRISVTDRCNLRCQYCMPEQDYVWLPKGDLLHFEEIDRLVGEFVELGVRRLRITGGEPLLRRDLPRLIRLLAARPGIEEVAITTNGVLLGGQVSALKEAGLDRVTVSLDTLRPDRFVALARQDRHADVLRAVDETVAAFGGLKIDAVIMRGINDDELVPLIEYGRERRAEVRFIEYMDVGGATRWAPERVYSREQMLAALTAHYGTIEPIVEASNAPAQRFRLADGTVFGIIASTTAPFCRTCNRSRLTADGVWYLCLYATEGLDLRRLLRSGTSLGEIRARLEAAWEARTDRGAEERLEQHERVALVPLARLKTDPHLEMHTRGG